VSAKNAAPASAATDSEGLRSVSSNATLPIRLAKRTQTGSARNGTEGVSGRVVAKRPCAPKTRRKRQQKQGAIAAEKCQNGLNENRTSLRWEQINAVTYKLFDPAAPQIETPRSRGQWAGFLSPSALAWVFAVGGMWRVRVSKRGRWQAYGVIIDLPTAQRLVISKVRP
jgi:hypothetical protein